MSSLLICPQCHHWQPAREVDEVAELAPPCPLCGARYSREATDSSSFIDRDPTLNLHPLDAPPPPSIELNLQGIALETPHQAEPPIELPGYELLGEVGRGGMGVVFKARQRSLNRIVAVKMLLGGQFADADHVTRFRLEAEAVARLRHPNIVQVFDVGSHLGQPYFAMEFVEGDSFLRRYADPVDPDESARVIVELARAVHHAHEEGIIHRDLKPANILVTRDGGLKITDFGLARRLDLPSGVTVSGTFVGTPEYMAPEQASGMALLGPGADIYALGVLLYELLTGKPPLRGESVWETLERVRETDPTPPSRLRAGIPCDLEKVCLKCLQKDPHRRYTSACDLADDLERFRRGEPVKARPVSGLERVYRWARRRPATTILLLTVALVFVVGLPVVTLLWLEAAQARAAADRAAHLQSAALAAAREKTLEANRLREQAEQREIRLALDRGLTLCEEGEVARGLLWLTRVVELLEHQPYRDDAFETVVRRNLAAWKERLVLPIRTFQHPERVNAIAFTPDGKTMLTGSNMILRWNVERGRLRGPLSHALPEDLYTCWTIAVSLDGQTALTGRSNGSGRLWNLTTGKSQGEMLSHGPRNNVWSAALSPDGRRAFTGDGDGKVRIWDTVSGKLLGEPFAHKGGVSALAVSSDGKTLLSGGWDRVARLWRLGEPPGPAVAELPHTDKVLAVTFAPEATHFCTACRDGTVQLWDAATTERVGEPFRHLDEATSVAFSPDGGVLLTGSHDDTARLWDRTTGLPIGRPLPHDGDVEAVAFTPDGTACVVGGHKGCRMWKLPRPLAVGPPLGGHRLAIDALGVGRDGNTLYAGSRNHLSFWNAIGRLEASVDSHFLLQSTALEPSGAVVAVAPWPGNVEFWDLRESRPGEPRQVHPLAPLEEGARRLTYAPDGRRLFAVSARKQGEILVWEVSSQQWLEHRLRHSHPILAMATSSEGTTLLLGASDGTAALWNVETGQPTGVVLQHPDAVTAVAVTADGSTLATGTRDGTLRLWQANGSLLLRRQRHRGAILTLAFAPDGRTLVSGSADHSVRLWDVATGLTLGPSFGHRDAVQAALFTPDGKTIVTGGRDRTVRRWQPSQDKLEGDAEVLRRQLEQMTGLTWESETAIPTSGENVLSPGD